MHRKSFVLGILAGIAIVSLIAFIYILGKEAIDRFSVVTNMHRMGLSIATPTTQSEESIEKQWNIIPVSVQSESVGNGWALVTIDLAMENNSNEWIWNYSIPDTLLNNITLETADGFVYSADPTYGSGSYVDFQSIPPGFRSRGHFSKFNKRLSVLRFRVAENTTGYKVTIPQYTYHANTNTFTIDDMIYLNLDSDVRNVNFPTDLPVDSIIDFNSPKEFEGIGTIVLDNCIVTKAPEERTLTLRMTYKNASPGYEQAMIASIYMIGKKGIMYQFEHDFGLSAGPGQSTSQTLNFNFPIDDDNMKIIIRFLYGNNFSRTKIYDVGTCNP